MELKNIAQQVSLCQEILMTRVVWFPTCVCLHCCAKGSLLPSCPVFKLPLCMQRMKSVLGLLLTSLVRSARGCPESLQDVAALCRTSWRGKFLVKPGKSGFTPPSWSWAACSSSSQQLVFPQEVPSPLLPPCMRFSWF